MIIFNGGCVVVFFVCDFLLAESWGGGCWGEEKYIEAVRYHCVLRKLSNLRSLSKRKEEVLIGKAE